MATKIQLRRDTSINWASVNPVLSAGELGFDTDLKQSKIGNGSTPWLALDFIRSGTSSLVQLLLETLESYPSNFTDVQYSNGVITRIDQWNNSSKGVHIFSKVYTYDQQNRIKTEVVTSEMSGEKMTKTILYDGSGLVSSITRSFEA